MTEPQPHFCILDAEHFGVAEVVDGHVDIGGIKVPWRGRDVHVYVRRDSADLSVIEIHMARHDGLAQEELDRQNDEAARYPLGPKEYWRGQEVGKYQVQDGQGGWRLMTNEDFEEQWAEGHDD